VRVRATLGVLAIAFLASVVPAIAADATLAPADEYFGRFNLSVLAIANSIRDSGTRIDAGADPHDLIAGPLAFATDAMHAWEAQYPNDPWIAKDLLALEAVYLKMPTDTAFRLASRTEAWLLADFPTSPQCDRARQLLAQASPPAPPAPPLQAAPPERPSPRIPSYAMTIDAWQRYAAMRDWGAPR
jgi:hypothetical protein